MSKVISDDINLAVNICEKQLRLNLVDRNPKIEVRAVAELQHVTTDAGFSTSIRAHKWRIQWDCLCDGIVLPRFPNEIIVTAMSLTKDSLKLSGVYYRR